MDRDASARELVQSAIKAPLTSYECEHFASADRRSHGTPSQLTMESFIDVRSGNGTIVDGYREPLSERNPITRVPESFPDVAPSLCQPWINAIDP